MKKLGMPYVARVVDKVLLFTLIDLNVIGMIDISNGNFKYILGPKNESPFVQMLYGDINKWHEYLILTPYNAKKIWIYDLVKSKWKSYDVTCLPQQIQEYKFMGSVIYYNKVFMIGDHARNIYVFDMVSRKGKFILEEENQLWGECFLQYDNLLYIGISKTNKLLVLDLENYNQKYLTIGAYGQIVGIDMLNSNMWFALRENRSAILIHKDLKTNTENKYHIDCNGNVSGMLNFNENEILIYGTDMSTYVFNVHDEGWSEYTDTIIMGQCINKEYVTAITKNNRIFLFNKGNKQEFVLNLDNELLESFFNEYKYRRIMEGVVIQEIGEMNLGYFMKMVVGQ